MVICLITSDIHALEMASYYIHNVWYVIPPQVFPDDLLPHTYPDPQNPSRLLGRSELERRGDYMTILHHQLGESHPLVELVKQCLHNDPEFRPTAETVLHQLDGVVIDDPYQHLTKLDLI